jgi:hypothetical protein
MGPDAPLCAAPACPGAVVGNAAALAAVGSAEVVLMGKRSRTKGARGEREVVELLRAIFEAVRRGAAQSRKGSDAADVEGSPYWIEVKIGQRPNILAAMEQACADTDGRPPVVFTRRDGETWLVTMRAEDWVREHAPTSRLLVTQPTNGAS